METIDAEALITQYLPFGLYYKVSKHTNTLEKRFGDLEKAKTRSAFVEALKRLTRFNDLLFITEVKDLSEDLFLKELNVQYNLYEKKADNMLKWLSHTDKLIFEGLTIHRIDNKYLINAYIEWSKLKTVDPPLAESKGVDLASIFNVNNNAFEICKELLEDLDITIAGRPNIKNGRVGKLTGLITAIKETPGMLVIDKPTEDQLLSYFNKYLGSAYKTFSKRNQAYKATVLEAKAYIKRHFKKK